MNPTSPANPLLKHTKPQFYMGEKEVRSRNFSPLELCWVLKSTMWALSSLSLVYKNNYFQPHSGPRAILMCSNALHCDFIAHIVLK